MEDFECLYRQHAETVLRYAMRCVGRKDVAEDIASEAFWQLHKNMGSIDIGRLPAWLFTVVRNRAIDYWRRYKLETEYTKLNSIPAEPSFTPSDGNLLQCSALKDIHRICLILHYVHGMTRTEIAEFTGLRETQIKGYLRSGLSILREALISQTR